MWDGPADDDPEVIPHHRPLDKAIIKLTQQNKDLGKQNEALAKENFDLKELLKAHSISWLSKTGCNTIFTSPSLPARSSGNLPNELQLRILKYALELAHPIIDPGVKILESNVTESEHAEQQNFPVQFLRVSKFFNHEGKKLMFRNNEFVFTQVCSLKWFVKTHPEICAELEHLELRIVGKYYNDRGNVNSPYALGWYPTSKPPPNAWEELKMDVIKRCPSVNLSWTGLQSYCWRQIFEFLQALQLPENSRLKHEKTAFTNLKSMVIDLANFTMNLSGPGIGLRKMARENLGPILDELYIRGLPKYNNGALAFECLSYLVRDGGLSGYGLGHRFTSTLGGRYLGSADISELGEDLNIFLGQAFKTQPEHADEETRGKHIVKELSKTFAEYEGDKVYFHSALGAPIRSEGTGRITVLNPGLIKAVELNGIQFELNHDQDLDDEDLEEIYGKDRVHGGGISMEETWDIDQSGGPDARICDNCRGMYGYHVGNRKSLERDGEYGAEIGFFREIGLQFVYEDGVRVAYTTLD
ncbi:hypothetical protein OCU04_006642 [Sclerotinia nivalis]|uniref:Uncharacterized protein n=1 Tax=Sclerotinia nivalis TaxID=352851 RepID=A0A9X0AK80_9HELO|nr:hypothetical protein OCU04_006642 [Sclerotinia nivalis]